MKVLRNGLIIFATLFMSLASWAKEVTCSNLESTTYLKASAYSYERIRNPFGNWSASLVPEIEKKFSECLSKYINKYGEEGNKTKKVKKSKVYFESVRAEISHNIKIKSFQLDNKQRLSKSYSKLEGLLKEYGLVYSIDDGFSNSKLKLVREGMLYDDKAEGFQNRLPKPLTETNIEDISKLINSTSKTGSAYKAFSQENNISLKELGVLSAIEQQVNTSGRMVEQFNHYLNEKRLHPYLEVYKNYSQKVLKKVEPNLSEYQSGSLNLRESVAKPHWSTPELFEIEQLLDTVIRSHQMLVNRGMDQEVLRAISPGLTQAIAARDNYGLLYEAINVAIKANEDAELAVLNKEQEGTKQYINRSQSSAISQQFESIGHPDAILSLGRFGNPINSTYATVQCLSDLYEAVKITNEGKIVIINFGDDGLFALKPKYTIKLSLVKDYTIQYVPIDFINHEEMANITDRGKVLGFVSLVRRCSKSNGINLIN